MKPQSWRIRYKGTRSLVIGAVDKPRLTAEQKRLIGEGRKLLDALREQAERDHPWLKETL